MITDRKKPTRKHATARSRCSVCERLARLNHELLCPVCLEARDVCDAEMELDAEAAEVSL